MEPSPALARDLLLRAADLVGGDRAATHGDKHTNHANIAALWSAWLSLRIGSPVALGAHDAAAMMVLLKLARTLAGTVNPDDYIDAAGYAGVAGEIALIPPPDPRDV